MSISLALYAVLGGGIVALAYALVRTLWIYKQKVSDQSLKEIGGHIADGAMAFLRREYLTLLPFIRCLDEQSDTSSGGLWHIRREGPPKIYLKPEIKFPPSEIIVCQ